ncbi:MAG: UDP-N-acetylmuramoyl-tripeptide--D-alanyl-D-alanine ligase, partial [Actinobacteria bacterium]|nr:UDP-N-acetylmuramoyl-tripeptide--D-alanyl-D-alanine ligase [Actinomycetota bacterium]
MLTSTLVSQATGGRISGDVPAQFPAASTDSRSLAAGELFVALRGHVHDGHEFARDAVAAGAGAVLVESEIPGLPCIVVADTLVAYGQIAAAHLDVLRQQGLTVIGLTGSSGKTTTKDLMSSVLSKHLSVVAAEGSLNNDIGLPATVLRADPSTNVLILEMGMRGLGHIQRLCQIAAPDISVVLNVGHAHIGELGSQDAIARAKAEIVQYARNGATAVLNGDDHRVRAMSSLATGGVVLFGETPDCSVRAGDITLDAEGAACFALLIDGCAPVAVRLGVLGRHQVSNACAVAAVAHHLGIGPDAIAADLGKAHISSKWRMELHRTQRAVTVLNDAYNANPDSMAAALQALSQIPCEGKRVAVLGEMLELGDSSSAAHRRIGELATELGIDLVVAVGDCAGQIAEGRDGAPTHIVADVAEAVGLAKSLLKPGDVVLVKASRSV